MTMEKTYSPDDIETRWYSHWEQSGAFKCGKRPDAEPYTIVIPPPNVTGSLHMGHALDNTLQDILIRYERLKGKDCLWQVGLDHAGIATQMVVERQLDEEGIKRTDLGREKFLERVWKWKAESGGTIIGQLKRLGASCDWERERFTMDDGFHAAVMKKFVTLYNDNLLYKDQRLVNWDPKLKTAISDLEVEQKEVDGHFWHFKYPVEGMEDTYLTVATTRPETMLGDTGVAVHPDDERFKHLVGKNIILPLVGRKIPIVADTWADPEQGSGAVKITPAHDFNDFEVGKRCDLEMINILDEHAHLNDNVPEKYRGLERYVARKQVVADLDALGLLEKVEPHKHTVPVGDRGGVPIEPWLTIQWYVDAETLAKPAIAAIENGDTKFIPKNWEKTYFEWMRNIQPWCVSRQLWWGHRIPAWYAADGTMFVAETEAEAYAQAKEKLGADVVLTQDEDVLDTWFSSALWPFGTMGWPEDNPDVARYYPNATLVTGFDIIFFWVARMMMDGLYFMGEVPFKNVYIHALVRDEKGAKMSKSKGNVIDPLDYIERFGADALRFTLAAMEAQGRDIKLSESRVEGYRNFGTKLWNATRFAEMYECVSADKAPVEFDASELKLTINKWIVGEVKKTADKLTSSLDNFRFNDSAAAIYHFTWGTFCDWYVELVKPILQGDDADAKAEVQATMAFTLDNILTMLHPFMPFITEELWHATAKRDEDLILSAWPDLSGVKSDQAAVDEVNWLINTISEVRSVRAELNVPAGAKIPAIITGADAELKERLLNNEALLSRLSRISMVEFGEAPSGGAAQVVLGTATMHLPLEGVMDLDAEKARLSKAMDKTNGEIRAIEGRLGNEQYLAKAPAHVVEKAKGDVAELKETLEKLGNALERLG
ncbi:MAG: valine--tRNA ligase [Sphingomonadales bacterium]|nr:valine--tRNA ligase [Sphingomonadales bacterium]